MHMDIEQKEQISRHRDWSDRAIAWRLRAAETLCGLTQKDLAKQIGVKPQTLNSQIIKGRPSIALMTYFYRNHRVDFNFIIFGDVVHLPADVQDRLVAILAEQVQS